MDNAGYVGLSRQSGLLRELNTIANNIANANTAGFRRESGLFAEHVKRMENGDPSLSIASLDHRYVDFGAGDIKTTGGSLDFAIEGDGFFLVESPDGPRLTRGGAFALNAAGEIVTAGGGMRVLDEGGGPIVVPQDATSIDAAPDGSISADGQLVGRLGVVAADPAYMVREGDNVFRAETGYQPVENARVRQGAIEGSNVNAVMEIAHLIEVQRAYETGQKFLSADDERIMNAVRKIGQNQ